MSAAADGTLVPHYVDNRVTLYAGDCLDVLRALPDESIDAVVTDPPYGLEFMGREWDRFRLDDPGTNRNRGERAGNHGELVDRDARPDRPSTVAYGGGKRPTTYRCTGCGKRDQFRNDHGCTGARWAVEVIDPYAAPPTMLAFGEWCRLWALECYRVLKPGAHLVAFGGSRTWHRLACGVENAGFELRDSLAWLYGSGFPKSMDVSKAIDRAAGAEREVVDSYERKGRSGGIMGEEVDVTRDVTRPATDEAKAWEGWGTALKPAFEPIVLGRKPLVGTVAENVLAHGTGALNIDACRLPVSDADRAAVDGREYVSPEHRDAFGTYATDGTRKPIEYAPGGRFPANVVLDETTAADLDRQTGNRPGSKPGVMRRGATTGTSIGGHGTYSTAAPHEALVGYGDDGGASRFFYTSKAPRHERPRADDGEAHPTVKPVDLMRWLVKLVTPPGGTVLDPFAGSGTTGEACVSEGFDAVLIEKHPPYLPLIVQRLSRPIPQALF